MFDWFVYMYNTYIKYTSKSNLILNLNRLVGAGSVAEEPEVRQ